MKEELDKLLCEKYPKMMVNRNKDMRETCMYWGFECGDGWYNILDQLMGNIQHHLDWKIKQRGWAIRHNELAGHCKNGNFDSFEEEYKDLVSEEFKEKRLADIIASDYREVPEPIPQVTLDQVKEKFGTLRFYYTGGDEYIHGMVTLAEAMSGVTCEECGKPGKQRKGGWIVTLCDEHAKERDEQRAKRFSGESDCD